MNIFRAGQKILCLDDAIDFSITKNSLIKGKIYTFLEYSDTGSNFCTLKEIGGVWYEFRFVSCGPVLEYILMEQNI